MSALSRRLPLFFLAIMALLICGSVYLRLQFDFNAGHMDEYDYLFVGSRLLSGASWPSYTYIFGSDFNWYVLGWGERYLGGLSGARMVATGFGLLSLLGAYGFVYALWRNHLTALIAVGLLALQSTQLFISRFATYDIISFACFTLSLAPLLLACELKSRARYGYLLMAIVLISMAVTSKYVVVLYLPVLGILALIRAPKIAVLYGVGVSVFLLSYVTLHWDDLQVLYRVQIQGVHGAGNGSLEYMLQAIGSYLWPALLGWTAAFTYCLWRSGLRFWAHRTGLVLVALLFAALPLVAYHLNALNMISLFKHLVYAQLFLLPACAWLFTQLLEQVDYRWLKQAALALALVLFAGLNYQQLQKMEAAYADVSPVLSAMPKALDEEITILSEDPYLFRYFVGQSVPQNHIKESNWLDNNRDGRYESKDVVDAIWDMKFSYVYLNDQLHPSLNKKLRKILKMRGYQELITQSYQLSSVMSRQTQGTLSLYKRMEMPRVSLTDDELFDRGKGLKSVKQGASGE
ncbi:ArnT family glycosyltransferase [Leucothrix mucor]|uniref:ArnT family glycosyltransferase n=1 Tax=Leucothrix mucor TaxID=45248 RepID=UPI0003B42124|nr:phospholipid carrier-dependent glycosyltransferase [Leucothrix mucor]